MSSTAPEEPDSPDSPLLGRQRREAIRALVNEQGAVRVRDLTERFDVSEMTVRRDIEALASAALVTRVHGGAVRIEPLGSGRHESGDGATGNHRGVRDMARRAAARIEPGTTIGIAAGWATYQLLPHISAIDGLAVVTNSITLAGALSPLYDELQIVLTGGQASPSNALVGPVAERCLADLDLDQVFLGAHGFGETGFAARTMAEARTSSAFVDAARQVCVLANPATWGADDLATIAPLDAADIVLGPEPFSDDAAAALTNAGVTVEAAST